MELNFVECFSLCLFCFDDLLLLILRDIHFLFPYLQFGSLWLKKKHLQIGVKSEHVY